MLFASLRLFRAWQPESKACLGFPAVKESTLPITLRGSAYPLHLCGQCARCQIGTQCADAVVLTVPLGCLREQDIGFKPALPPWKLRAVNGLASGLCNRVVMVFPHAFWDRVIAAAAPVDQQSRWNAGGHASRSGSRGWQQEFESFGRLASLGCEDRGGRCAFGQRACLCAMLVCVWCSVCA